jgi:DHA3 family macrolide efflux protein-like MFS transporter
MLSSKCSKLTSSIISKAVLQCAMRHYVQLLKEEPILRRLTLLQLISYFGAWFSNVAIYTLLVYLDVSAFLIALVASLHFLPGVLQAPFSGVMIDKFLPKNLMLVLIVIEIVSTLLLLLITSISWLWLLFILIFIRMGAASFYFTIEMALLPKILQGKSLQYANEIHSIIWSFSYTVGMALSGLLVYQLGVKMAFILDVMLFIIAFFMLWNLQLSIEMEKNEERFLQSVKSGIHYLKTHPKIIHLILVHATVGFTVFDALVALMAKEYYARILAVPLAIGIIHAIRALALVIGPIVLGKHLNSTRLVYLLLFQGVAVMVWGSLVENFYLSLTGAFAAGFVTTSLWSYTYTLIQTHTDKQYYGRVVAYNDMVFLLTSALSSFFIGILVEHYWTLSEALYLIGAMFILSAIYFVYIRKSYHV